MMKLSSALLLAPLLLAACGPSNDSRPVLQNERDTLNQAKKVDSTQQQEAQKQQQEAEKQAQ